MAARESNVARSGAPALVSHAHGRIEQVLLTVPFWVLRYAHQPEIRPFVEAFAGLLTLLPADAERVVVTRAEAADAAEAWIASLGVKASSRVVPVSDHLRFTPWAQDACLVQTTPEGRRLLTPGLFPRMDDAEVLAAMAADLGLPIHRSDLIFQGGNVLVGDDFWLMGADAVLESVAGQLAGEGGSGVDAQALAGDVVQRFCREVDAVRTLHLVETERAIPHTLTRPLGEEPLKPGAPREESVYTGSRDGTRQPLFDIDTFVSLGGRGGDGRYRLLVGDPRAAAVATATPLPDHALADAFDEVARALGQAGFEVRRNPLPLVSHDDPPTRSRWWYFASSNNAVTEIDGDRRRVWMPTYGDDDHPELERTDALNAEAWRALGFEVIALPSFHVAARGLGAARCMVKCLKRSR